MLDNSSVFASLREILCGKAPTAVFQPIIDLDSGEIVGYEGMIRGPSDSALHAPQNLFRVARQCELSLEVEQICREVTLQRFVDLGLPGKLFLNVSPECLTQPNARNDETIGFIKRIGLNPERVIIELTESQPTYDYSVLREAALYYRSVGFEIAIDDLGEGFSSLRLWAAPGIRQNRHALHSRHQSGSGEAPFRSIYPANSRKFGLARDRRGDRNQW